MSERIAVYPGTFDPLTFGHEDLARRAARIFDKVIVAIAESASKRPFFTLEERVGIARDSLAEYPNVEVESFDGLLMDFMRRKNALVIIRGLRALSDFEYEFQMAGMNRNLNQEVETMFLTPSDEFMFVSATKVREIAQLGGSVEKFVRPAVNRLIQQKLNKE